MEEKPHKKGLYLKVALITLVASLCPVVLAIFFFSNPIYKVAVAILVAVLSIFILLRMLKPLSSLLKGTETLSQGNLNFRVDVRSGDEFESLGQSFNLMAEKLQQSFTKLEQDTSLISAERNRLSTVLSSLTDGIMAIDFNKNIILANKAAESLTGYTLSEMQGRPIDEFIHLFDDSEELTPKSYCQINSFGQVLNLLGKNGKEVKVGLTASPVSQELQTNLSCILLLHDLSREQELEQMKLDFVSMASHELKTPLTSIMGYLSVFINENRGKIPRDELDLLEKSLVSSQQLLTLIQNILNVNKIEKEKLTIAAEPIDYASILAKVVMEDLQNQAKQKNITLTLTPSQTPLPKVLADPLRITEVVTNLVANAINYTNPGGQVNVFVHPTPQEVITTVSDTGVGIPKEALSHLFNKFFRVSNQLQKASKGTGLGLYIAKSIIEKLNGKIWVESEVGKGSKFSFTLPVVRPTGALDSNKFVHSIIQSGGLNY